MERLLKELPSSFYPHLVFLPVYKPSDFLIEGDEYELAKAYPMIISDKRSYYRVTAKKGFRYDGFSIPWGLRIFHHKHAGALGVALMHDLEFSTHFLGSVAKADWMFLLGLEYRDDEYNWFVRNTMWSFLRCGSWQVYPKKTETIVANRKFLKIEDISHQYKTTTGI